MKKAFLLLCLLAVPALACNVLLPATPKGEAPPPTQEIFIPMTQAAQTTAAPTAGQSFDVTVYPLTFALPPELAGGASGSQIPPASGEDVPYWELTPGHTQIKLDGYLLQGKFHEPQIFVYPAQGYADLFPGASESIDRLRNVMNAPGSISADQLPAVPFFNAAQVFASNIQTISFQSGSGVRFLTEYAQNVAPINNHDLVYHFQGLTGDGAYYILAILPIANPVLAEAGDFDAGAPAGGIAFPDINDPNADYQAYYASVTDLLNAAPPDAFTPTLSQLDALIQSMRVAP